MSFNKNHAIIGLAVVIIAGIAINVIFGLTQLPANPNAPEGEVLFEGHLDVGTTNMEFARVVSNKHGHYLRVQYREGILFPNLLVPVNVNQQLVNQFVIERMDTHQKYIFLATDEFSGRYVCTECITANPKNPLPLEWFRH